jgi:hypothetical protein
MLEDCIYFYKGALGVTNEQADSIKMHGINNAEGFH